MCFLLGRTSPQPTRQLALQGYNQRRRMPKLQPSVAAGTVSAGEVDTPYVESAD